MNCCSKSFAGLGLLLVGVCGFALFAAEAPAHFSAITSGTAPYTEALIDSHNEAVKNEAVREPVSVTVENSDGLVVKSNLFTECISKRQIRRR